uniref:Uncharacterized protein n=1 Tax=Arundo donax TaxID=35708 RepID=A0A0A8YC58_ARUDO
MIFTVLSLLTTTCFIRNHKIQKLYSLSMYFVYWHIPFSNVPL